MEHLTFRSFDEYAAAVQHADIRVTLCSREQTHWALDHLPLKDMSIQWGQDAGPNVVEGSSWTGGLTLFLPHTPDSIIGNGCRMDKGSVMVLEPGVEFCMAASCANRWSSIFVPSDQLSAFNVPGTEINRKHRVLSPTEAGERLHRLAENLGAACQNVSDAAWSASAIATAKRRIAEAACEVLGFQNQVAAASSGRQTLSRAQITRAALQILEEYSDERVSVNRLSSMVGVSERTLRAAFEDYFGIAPTRYLKVRTLHQARNLLKRSDPHATSVTEVAVGLGIWELGRFSQDYKLLFDELPSETLRNN